MNYDIDKKIKEIAKSKDITLKALCDKIDISESGLNYTLKNNTLKIATLQKIAEELNVPITSFFNDGSDNKEMQKLIQFLGSFFKGTITEYFGILYEEISESYIDKIKRLIYDLSDQEINAFFKISFKKPIDNVVKHLYKNRQIKDLSRNEQLHIICIWATYNPDIYEILDKEKKEKLIDIKETVHNAFMLKLLSSNVTKLLTNYEVLTYLDLMNRAKNYLDYICPYIENRVDVTKLDKTNQFVSLNMTGEDIATVKEILKGEKGKK